MITGNQNPEVGKQELYTVHDTGHYLPSADVQYVWNIWKKQKNGTWKDITQKPPKTGMRVPFTFGEKVTGTEFRLDVFKAQKKLLSNEWEAKKAGSLTVIPGRASESKIVKVVLFNRGVKDINKASYQDTLIARAHCVGLFNREITFQLWEDDAPGPGHHAEINKQNQMPGVFKARVNKNGIAEAKIPLTSNPRVLQAIADKFLMKGDQDEGAYHEYYVTASYEGKIRGASQVNVNVVNPAHKSKPKDNSAIFPGTSAKSPRADQEKKVTHAYFVDLRGNPVTKVKVGDTIKVRIRTTNMLNQRIQFVIWEYDVFSDDRIHTSPAITIQGDSMDMPAVTITQALFNKGIDSRYLKDPDRERQQYYIEVIPLELNVSSSKFGLANSAEKSLEVVRSAAKVRDKKVEKNEEKRKGSCSCNNNLTKEQLKAIAINASQANVDKYLDGFNETFIKFKINSCLQKLHFLTQVIHESGSFRYNVEQGNATYLAKYGGWHGRGLIQLTTKSNYEAFEKAIGEDVTSSKEARDKVTKSPYAVYSAGWFWDKRAVLNGFADENDFIYITYRVNGGYNHINDRLAVAKRGFMTLYSKCVNDEGKTTDYKFADSKAYNDKKACFAWGLWHDPQFNKAGCEKDKDLAIEGYQRYVELTTETDSTANYYGIQNLSYFSDLIYTKTIKGKEKKYVSVRKAALKRLNDLK